MKPNIPALIGFIKSFDKWKAGGSTLESYIQMPCRLTSMAAAKFSCERLSKVCC